MEAARAAYGPAVSGSPRVGSWAHVPFGCSVQTRGDWSAHLNTNASAVSSAHTRVPVSGCPAGMYIKVRGDCACHSCASCSEGQFVSGCGDGSAGTCQACPVGKYKTTRGRAQMCKACETCPEGKSRGGCGGSSPGKCFGCIAGRYKGRRWQFIANTAYYDGSQRQVTKSHLYSSPYTIQAYRRKGQSGDPWLQPGKSHSKVSALYAEDNYNVGTGEGSKNKGLNVFVRDAAQAVTCPPSRVALFAMDSVASAGATLFNSSSSVSVHGVAALAAGRHGLAMYLEHLARVKYASAGQSSENSHGVSLWFKTTDASIGLFCMGSALVTYPRCDRSVFLEDGMLQTRVSPATPTKARAAALNDDFWHHVAHTIGPKGERVWVDGALVSHRTDITSSTTAGPAQEAWIGWSDDVGAGANLASKTMDSVAIFSGDSGEEALEQDDVDNLYVGGACAKDTPTRRHHATNCEITKVGVGWTLVRRTLGNSHPAADDLAGTDVYGMASDNPEGSGAFSMNFEASVPRWGEMLLATGTCNHWMVMPRESAIGTGTAVRCGAAGHVECSSASGLDCDWTSPTVRQSVYTTAGSLLLAKQCPQNCDASTRPMTRSCAVHLGVDRDFKDGLDTYLYSCSGGQSFTLAEAKAYCKGNSRCAGIVLAISKQRSNTSPNGKFMTCLKTCWCPGCPNNGFPKPCGWEAVLLPRPEALPPTSALTPTSAFVRWDVRACGQLGCSNSGGDTCEACLACPPGLYRDGCGASGIRNHTGNCLPAPAGRFKVLEGAWDTMPVPCGKCSAGKFRQSCGGKSPGTCAWCPQGKFKTFAGATGCEECQLCTAGRYREPHVQTVAAFQCALCSSCPDGTFTPLKVRTNATLFQPCDSCPPCEDAALQRVGCSGSESGLCAECPQGRFKAALGNCTACGKCSAGTQLVGCSARSTGSCQDCPLGKFKSDPGPWFKRCEYCTSCVPGFRKVGCSGTSAGRCDVCPVGQFKAQDIVDAAIDPHSWKTGCSACTARCAVGEYLDACGGGSRGTCTRCPTGKFMLPGNTQWNATCSQCRTCGPGTQLTGCSLGTSGDCVLCEHGRFRSDRASDVCTPCAACAPGTYRNNCGANGGASSGICEPSSSGFFKTGWGLWSSTEVRCASCPAGKFRSGCGGDSAGKCEVCPAGKFQDANATWMLPCKSCQACMEGQERHQCGNESSGNCSSCAAGQFKAAVGDFATRCSSCQPCSPRRYREGCGQGQSGACRVCPTGKFKLGDEKQSSWNSSCFPCKHGYACAEGGREECKPGTFGDSAGASECKLCPTGRFSNSSRQIICAQCEPGHLCPAGSFDPKARKCGGASQFCPGGWSRPLSVGIGNYSTGGDARTRTGQRICEDGSYCTAGERHVCPRGSYCQQQISGSPSAPLLTGSSSPVPCGSSNFYCPAGSSRRLAVSTGNWSIGGTE
jgi:hypothetical protein